MIKTFDSIMIQILPVSVEFRRQIKFIFKNKVNLKRNYAEYLKDHPEESASLSEALAKKPKKKKKSNK